MPDTLFAPVIQAINQFSPGSTERASAEQQARAWAANNKMLAQWDAEFYGTTKTSEQLELERMMAGVAEVSKIGGFELIPIDGFYAPRVIVLRFRPAVATDVCRVLSKFKNVAARVPGIGANPPPTVRIIDGGIEVLCARKKWEVCHLLSYIKPRRWNCWDALTLDFGVELEGAVLSVPIIHVQIAGTSGGGKTVLMNSLLGSVAMQYKPTHVQWMLLDVEKVGLCQFNGLAWFWKGVDGKMATESITDLAECYRALEQVLQEHERRLNALSKAGVDCLEKYNRRNSQNPIPRLLVVIDEYALLLSGMGRALSQEVESDDPKTIATIAKEGRTMVESLTIEISQRCRKTGIHLIVASQSARADIFDVNLRDNLATKVALKCVSPGASAVAFGYVCDDAVRLAGNGDMWVVSGGETKRAQGFYIDDETIGPNGKTKLQQLIDLAKKVQA